MARPLRIEFNGALYQVTSRSDIGGLGYGPADGCGPHAVVSVNGGGSFACNADGDYTADNGRTLTWTAFDKPTTIDDGGTTVTLSYDAERMRYEKQVSGATTETVTYLGGAERLDISGNVSIRRTITLAGEMVAIDTGGSNGQLLYAVTDHLGSPIALTDTSGALVEGLAYGPFGRRMTTDRSAYLTISTALTINETDTDKGFTGQESLDSVGLDDYNARIYDPALGRFLSVDPLLAHPESTQGINPYSYCANNPLNSTDPTGEGRKSGPTGWDGMVASVGGAPAGMTEGQAAAANVGGEGIGGIDWNVGTNSKGDVTLTPSSGPGSITDPKVWNSPLGTTGQDPQKTSNHTKINNNTPTQAGGDTTITTTSSTASAARGNASGNARAQIIKQYAVKLAKAYGVPVNIALAVIQKESAFNLRWTPLVGQLVVRDKWNPAMVQAAFECTARCS